MQKGINYPFRKYVRLSADSNTKLAKVVKAYRLPESVVLRVIIERALEEQTLTSTKDSK